jgi:hypothetical protein
MQDTQPLVARDAGIRTYRKGSFVFYNPVDQYLLFSEVITYMAPASAEGADAPGFAGLPFYVLTAAKGQTSDSGPPPPQIPEVPTKSQPSASPPPSAQNSTATPPPKSVFPHRIYAMIVSGQSDPAKVLPSQNTILIGGVVALGTASPAIVLPWSTGLRIMPDPGLILGNKIPPIVPSLIDLRIVRFESAANFSD